jgi:hypothetical protein
MEAKVWESWEERLEERVANGNSGSQKECGVRSTWWDIRVPDQGTGHTIVGHARKANLTIVQHEGRGAAKAENSVLGWHI